MAEIPTLAPAADGGCVLTSPYSEHFVEELKALFPRGTRTWDPDAKTWWIAEHLRDDLVKLCLRFWPSVMVMGSAGEDDYFISRDGTAVQQTRLL